MALNVDTLAVIRSINEKVGESVSFTELKFLYRYYGGEKGKLGRTLERVVERWPECVEWENRIGDGRRLEVWVRVKQPINAG